ncbi:MAG: hypothetical protein V2I82_06685, partial [Halieaceae bacterium]|nr:hypothetical protein [Halieaceae bacterium]
MALARRNGQRFQNSIWPGFVDAMTGLLLVLIFVLTIFMVVQYVLTEEISGQESELDTLSQEVGALARALGLAQRRNADLEERVGELSATLEAAEDEASRQEALIASLQTRTEEQASALEGARARITEILQKLEARDPELTAVWNTTRQ